MQDRGDGDGDGVDRARVAAVVVQGDRAAPRGDGLGLVAPGVGDGDELDTGHGGQNPGVVLTEMAHAHDAHPQLRHADLPRSRARPCLPRC